MPDQLLRRQSPTKRERRTTSDQRLLLRKFIHHPVVFSSLDQRYFGKSARDMGSSKRDQHDRETVKPVMPMAARDLEGPVRAVRKKLFQFVGVLRVADVIAEQDDAAFEISCLPCVQEMVSGCQRKHVTGVRGIFLLGRMAVRSSPDWGRQKDRQKEKTCC
jgi:hypothetical protein